MRATTRLLALLAVLSLTACSSHNGQSSTPPPATVQTVTPVQKTFHTKVTAFGQLAANRGRALSLSLPQPGRVIATEVIAGQRVTRGQPLLKLKTSPAARKAYLQARNGVKVARENLAHIRRLRTGKLATNAQVDTALKTLANAKATLAAQAALGGGNAVAILKAPADGVVTALTTQPGQRLTAGVPLVAFSPASALAALLGVEPSRAAHVRPGMRVSIEPVYGGNQGHPLAGTVTAVSHAINPTTHLINVVVTLAAPTHIAVGTALSATIETSAFKAWAIPRDALESDAKGSYIFQIEHGKAVRVGVKVLAPAGSPIGVVGALDSIAPVIALGSYEVTDGETVQAAKPAPASTKGAAT